MKRVVVLLFVLQLGIGFSQTIEKVDFRDIKQWESTPDWKSKLAGSGIVKFSNSNKTSPQLVYKRLDKLTLSKSDFDLSFSFQDIKNGKFAFVLGSNDLSYMFAIYVDPKGATQVKHVEPTEKTYFDGQFSNFNKKKVKNTIRLVKDFSLLTIYFNNKKVGTYRVGTLYSTTAFFLEGKSSVQVSDFSVTEVKRDLSKIKMIDNPNAFGAKKKLSDQVNSDCEELLPVVSPDDNTLFFVRDAKCKGGEGGQDIYVSKRDASGAFGPAKNIGTPLNTSGPNVVSKVLPDGTLLLLNKYGGSGACAIARPDGENTYSFPSNISVNNYSNSSDYKTVTLSASGKVMLFAIERDDTNGERDIYVSFKKNNEWSSPKNCGMVLNSKGEESSLFIAPDDKTLYFSSNGHRGYGGYDIFVSKRQDDSWTNWSEPKNLGNKINTKSWDGYFTISASGKTAYVSSSVDGSPDIYEVPITVAKGEEKMVEAVVLVKGKVLNSKTNAPIAADIHYFDLETSLELGVAKSNPKTGAYQIILNKGKNYSFYANEKGYFPTSANMNLKELEEYEALEKDLFLNPIEVNQTITLNNIFFETAKADLKDESKQELNRLLEFMKENNTVQIQISGHTDNVGSSDSNLSLSKNRAKAVQSYLISNGIQEHRVNFKGYGESKPKSSNTTDVGKALNRRVEFTILK